MKRHDPFIILILSALFLSAMHPVCYADDGYRLWLKYDRLNNRNVLSTYRENIRAQYIPGSDAASNVIRSELNRAFRGLFGECIRTADAAGGNMLIVAQHSELPPGAAEATREAVRTLGDEGFLIKSLSIGDRQSILITAKTRAGLLYGVFHFIGLLQNSQCITHLDIASSPKIKLRVLNHWDRMDRRVERGYAGFSLWDWHKLPDYIHPRYIDYARANASIGINGTVLNSVNANALMLTTPYLNKVAALAGVFRPFGIKVYLSIRFSAPIDIGGLASADPLDRGVQAWWKKKADEIYALIPDFGGFLVKANSEGQPGPGDYQRTHAEGANMLADALKPHGGVVMWRAFVYDADNKEDRAKQAYNEFKPLDGNFRENVLVQVKNGPIDFQPREPFHPLFGATPETPLMMEFQITQEYLGFSTHLVYLGTLFKEVLDADTYQQGAGSTVAKVIDGSLYNQHLSGIAGVANTGTDRNWTGHVFGQANWYVFGRLAWDPALSAEEIAREWIARTFSRDHAVMDTILSVMMSSREAAVNYMTPLGLHHIMGWDHHYGPAPWIKDKHRDDWTSVYYHRADSQGVGFDRTVSGSNALEQYAEPVQERFASPDRCPDEFLLWFHHPDWDFPMKSGKTLWEELCDRYYRGAAQVSRMRESWNQLECKIDADMFHHVEQMLAIQEKEAVWWRNACVLYFQTFSGLPVPEGLEKPDKTLSYYQNLSFPFAPK